MVKLCETCDRPQSHLEEEDVHVGVAILGVLHRLKPVVSGNVEYKYNGGKEIVQCVPARRECFSLYPDYVVDEHKEHA